MSKIAQAKVRGKSLAVGGGDVAYVGLDVHKRSIHAAVWLNGRVVRHWVMPAENEKVLRKLEPLRPALKQVVYEAGPTGYGLARFLRGAGLCVFALTSCWRNWPSSGLDSCGSTNG